MPFRISLTWRGRKRAEREFRTAPKRMQRQMQKEIRRLGRKGVRLVKSNMRGSRAKAARLGRSTTAPPGVLGVDSGRMKGAVTFDANVVGRSMFLNIYAKNIPYDRIHELGGRAGRGHTSLIPARPWLAPALKRLDEVEIPKVLGRVLKVAVRNV